MRLRENVYQFYIFDISRALKCNTPEPWCMISIGTGQKLNIQGGWTYIHAFHSNKPSFGTFWTLKILNLHPELNLHPWLIHQCACVVFSKEERIKYPLNHVILSSREFFLLMICHNTSLYDLKELPFVLFEIFKSQWNWMLQHPL